MTRMVDDMEIVHDAFVDKGTKLIDAVQGPAPGQSKMLLGLSLDLVRDREGVSWDAQMRRHTFLVLSHDRLNPFKKKLAVEEQF